MSSCRRFSNAFRSARKSDKDAPAAAADKEEEEEEEEELAILLEDDTPPAPPPRLRPVEAGEMDADDDDEEDEEDAEEDEEDEEEVEEATEPRDVVEADDEGRVLSEEGMESDGGNASAGSFGSGCNPASRCDCFCLISALIW